MKKVEIESKKRIFDDFFKIEEAHLRYERFDGHMSDLVRRLNFERGDSVAALLYNPEAQEIILVNQFKYPTQEKGPGWIIEVVAGMIDGDESPEAAIRREIMEETGFRTSRLEHVSTFYVSPGGSSERIIFYFAEVSDEGKIHSGGGVKSEQEDIQLIRMPFQLAVQHLANGEIVDAKTILGILWLQNRLANA